MDFQQGRQELEDFVIANQKHVNHEAVRQLVPDLRIDEEEGWLSEIVRSQNPYDVLDACFAEPRLATLALQRDLDLDDPDLKGRQLISAILETFGFPQEVTPSGITQIRKELNNYLNRVYDSPSLVLSNVGNIVDKLKETVQTVLNTIFLFFTYYLTEEEGTKTIWDHEGEMNTRVEHEEISNEITELYSDYCSKAKTFGAYVSFMRRLCLAIKKDNKVLQFHQRNFRHDTPISPQQLSELSIFVAYRNIIEHRADPYNTYEKNQKDVTDALKDLKDMSHPVYQEWQDNWNRVVDYYNKESSFPLDEMLKRMADFVRKFLNELCADPRVYPRVIVMRSRTIDDYGTYQITAVDDSDKTIFLTDCNFEPFVEFYYHSRTNPIGIEPLYLSKKELENWGSQRTDNIENVEDT